MQPWKNSLTFFLEKPLPLATYIFQDKLIAQVPILWYWVVTFISCIYWGTKLWYNCELQPILPTKTHLYTQYILKKYFLYFQRHHWFQTLHGRSKAGKLFRWSRSCFSWYFNQDLISIYNMLQSSLFVSGWISNWDKNESEYIWTTTEEILTRCFSDFNMDCNIGSPFLGLPIMIHCQQYMI